MQRILSLLSSEVIFWAAWVLIPLIMEAIPALFGFLVLIKKKAVQKSDKELGFFPEITLIIPVYNSEDTLEECLSSVYNSNYPYQKIFLLIVNNGSRDNSFKCFQKFQNSHIDMNLKWLNAKQGKSHALNMALFNSTGKYIVHIDSDGVLHPEALQNIITRFENNDDIHCMTGSILTNPKKINEIKGVFKRLFRKIEFFEYAQAFLAGRNFESEINSIFTISGAFSAFRKSTILNTYLYNTQTVCEDTHITFQVRHLLKKKIHICENAIFFVDPIEDIQRLYIQRQRWQRGEIEVAHMFSNRKKNSPNRRSEFLTRLLLYDHTFAFPRMIWYFALICLTFIEYPMKLVVISLAIIYIMYSITTFLYYLNVCSYLSCYKDLQSYYKRMIYIVFIFPFYNFLIFWFRFAGIINSIRGEGNWKTSTLKEEWNNIMKIIQSDFRTLNKEIEKIKRFIVNCGKE